MTYTDAKTVPAVPHPRAPRGVYIVTYPTLSGNPPAHHFFTFEEALSFLESHPEWDRYSEPRLLGPGAEESGDYYSNGLTEDEDDAWFEALMERRGYWWSMRERGDS